MAHVFDDPCNLNSDFEICDGSDTIIRWEHWRKLAELVDDLAVYLRTPGYTSVMQLIEPLGAHPFAEPKLPQVTGVLEFILEPGTEIGEGPTIPNLFACPTVTNRAILTEFDGIVVDMFSLPSGTPMPGQGAYQFYSGYAANEDLFFVNEEDGCWCKTIFKIDPGDSALTFVSTADPKFGCCQTLDPVPKIGDRLDYYQDIIPASYTCQWGDVDGIDIGSAEELLARGNGTIYCPKCWNNTVSQAAGCQTTPSEDMVQYKFTEFDPFNPEAPRYLLSVARPIKGYLTWPILKEHLDLIVDRLKFILQCTRHDGLRPACESHSPATATGVNGYNTSAPTLWHYDPTYKADGGAADDNGWHLWGYGCGAWDLLAWLSSLHYEFLQTKPGESKLNPNVPGTLVEPDGGNVEGTSQCIVSYKEPWHELTGGAQNCDSAGIRVYCDTINQLANLIITIGKRLWPYETFEDVESSDGCSAKTENILCCVDSNTCETMSARECFGKGGKKVDQCRGEGEGSCCSSNEEEICSTYWNPGCCEATGELIYNCTPASGSCSCDCPSTCEGSSQEFYCCNPDAFSQIDPYDTSATCEYCCSGPYSVGGTGGSTPEAYCSSVNYGSYPADICAFFPAEDVDRGCWACDAPERPTTQDCRSCAAQGLGPPCDPCAPCLSCTPEDIANNQCVTCDLPPCEDPCDDPCFACNGEENCVECGYTVPASLLCEDSPNEPCPYGTVTPITGDNQFCGDCGDDRIPTCCLPHEAFLDENDCVAYLDEIQEFVKNATNGEFSKCEYVSDIKYTDPDTGTVTTFCDMVTCGATCVNSLPSGMSVCLDQGGLHWELVPFIGDDGDDSNSWYRLLMSAPGMFNAP